MNNEEARQICLILNEADGGCGSCVDSLYVKFIKQFPDMVEAAKSVYEKYGSFEQEDFDYILKKAGII